MSKHTPGPWQTRKWCEVTWVINGPKIGVAQTVGGNDEANAHLIAAAPEMLAALKEACIYFKCNSLPVDDLEDLIKRSEGRLK